MLHLRFLGAKVITFSIRAILSAKKCKEILVILTFFHIILLILV